MRFFGWILVLVLPLIVAGQSEAQTTPNAVPKVNCAKGCINQGVNLSVKDEYYSKKIKCEKPGSSAQFEILCAHDVGAATKPIGGRSCDSDKGWAFAKRFVPEFCKKNGYSNCSISGKLHDVKTHLAGNTCSLTYYIEGENPKGQKPRAD